MGTAVRRYADEKDPALNVAVRAYTIQKTASARQYTDENVVEVKRYADERDVISRGLHVLKPVKPLLAIWIWVGKGNWPFNGFTKDSKRCCKYCPNRKSVHRHHEKLKPSSIDAVACN